MCFNFKDNLFSFSPTPPSGPSWSSSRDVCLFVCLSVCLSVCLFVSVMSPFHVIFLCGAECASSVDWCDLGLDLDLDLNLDLVLDLDLE